MFFDAKNDNQLEEAFNRLKNGQGNSNDLYDAQRIARTVDHRLKNLANEAIKEHEKRSSSFW